MSTFELRPREYQQLEVLAKHSHNAVAARRAHALLALHEGIPAAEIADLLNMSRQTVYNWAQAFRQRQGHDLAGRLLDAPRSGRPVTVLGVIDPLIDAIIDADPRDHGYRATVWTAALLQRYLQEVNDIETSQKSISRALARLGVRWKRPRHRLARRPASWHQAKGGSKTA